MGRIEETKTRIGALVDQLELGIRAIAERLRERQSDFVRLEVEANDLLNVAADRWNRHASDALVEAVGWWRRSQLHGGRRTVCGSRQGNGLLNEAFDWIMPVGDVEADGVYMGAGEQAWWCGRVEGTDTTAKFMVPEGTSITREQIEALRGSLPEFELPEVLRAAEEAERLRGD